MANEKDRPGVDTETAEVQTGGLNNSSLSGVSPIPSSPAPAKLGATVENRLDPILWDLYLGRIGLQDLTPALSGFWTLSHDVGYKAGYAAGEAEAVIELAQAKADRDRYYRAAYDPRKPVQVGPSYADLEATRAKTYRGEN